jgi:hypothetical protein
VAEGQLYNPDMGSNPHLTPLERQVLFGIRDLCPDDVDTDYLASPLKVSREAISYAVRHLIELKLVSAPDREGVNPLAPNFYDASLTAEGEQLRRDLARYWWVRWLADEWKWLVSTAIGVSALVLSLWNLFYPVIKK